MNFTIDRLPKNLQDQMRDLYLPEVSEAVFLSENEVHQGDALDLLKNIRSNSVALSVWSPPYFVGKEYEADLSFDSWQNLLKEVIRLHFPLVRPGGFLAVNIADILCFKDESMPRIQADVVSRKRSTVTREEIIRVMQENPGIRRGALAQILGCSEQTVDRRLHGNNIRGGKSEHQTRVKIVGGLLEQWALDAGFYPYDRRMWVKDPSWANSRWTSLSYRSVDEFEYVYMFWKPGVTRFDRSRLTDLEWRQWGSRAVWNFPSVRANDDHEAKFPLELPSRCIRLLTDPNDLVLDCFMGSGTTGVAAVTNGRRFIGIERDPRYTLLSRDNIARAALPEIDASKSESVGERPGKA